MCADRRRAEHMARRMHLRQHAARNIEIIQQLVVPVQRVDIEEHRARCVGVVRRVDAALCQLPEDPRIHRAKHQLARFGAAAVRIDAVEDPGQLRRRKISVDDQPRFFEDLLLPGAALDLLAEIRRAAALPDDRIIHRTPRCALPDDRRLALVGDADRLHIVGMDALQRQQLLQHAKGRRPQLHRILFDPARLRIILTDLLLPHPSDALAVVESDRPRARRPDI